MAEPSPVCPACGKVVLPEMTACAACGASLVAPPPAAEAPAEAPAAPPAEAPAPVPTGTCRSCNDPITAEMVWCGSCGHQLRAAPKVRKPLKLPKPALLAAVAVLLIGGGGAGAWFFFGGSGGPKRPVGPVAPPPSKGPTAADKKKAEELVKDARMAIRDKKWEQAERALAQAKALDPKNADLAETESRVRLGRAKAAFKRPDRTSPTDPEPVTRFCFRPAVSSGGRLAAVIVAGASIRVFDTVQLLDGASGQPRWERAIPLEIKGASLRAVAFSADGTALAVGGADRKLRLLSVADEGKEVGAHPHDGSIVDLAFTADGTRLVALNEDGAATAYALNPLRPDVSIPASSGTRQVMALDPAGKFVLLGSDKGLRVCPLAPGLKERFLKLEAKDFSAVAIGRDGKSAAVGTAGGSVLHVELDGGKTLATAAPLSRITQIAFDPGGRLLIVWNDQSGLMTYLLTPGLETLETFDTGMEPTTRFALAPDGGALVATGNGPKDRPLTSRVAVFRLESGP